MLQSDIIDNSHEILFLFTERLAVSLAFPSLYQCMHNVHVLLLTLLQHFNATEQVEQSSR